MTKLKIGDEVNIHGYIDEIRKDVVIIRNDGGYFGTVQSEIKALEQQTINSNATTEEIAQSFKADVEAVKDYLPKCNSMEFPKTFDEFANDYGFTDDKEIYTNGSHLIPVFRVKQWLDHIEQQPCDDCVRRSKVIQEVFEIIDMYDSGEYLAYEDEEQTKLIVGNDRENDFRRILSEWEAVQLKVNTLPPVTPTHGTCKDCNNWNEIESHKKYGICDKLSFGRDIHYTHAERFYCADFEKRSSENESIN